MKTIEIILTTLGLSLIFVYFLQLVNSNFLKELNLWKQFSGAITKGNRNDIDRYHNAWHMWKFALCFVAAGFISLILYGFSGLTYASAMAGLISGFFIWFVGDIFLNHLMGWKLFERGDKSGFDIVPFWVRLLILGILLALIFVSCDKKTTNKVDIDFIEQAKSGDMILGNSHVLIANEAEPLECIDIIEARKIIWDKSKTKDGIFVDKAGAVYLKISNFKTK